MTDFMLPAHVCKLWLVRVTDTAGQVLPPGGFDFYGCAMAPGGRAVAMVAEVRGDATELVLPGLCAPGAWDLSIFCREVATGVTWAVQQGRVNVTPAPVLAGVAPARDELVAVLDPVTQELRVALGDSTASAAENARLAVAAREGAEAAAERVAADVVQVEDLKRMTLSVAAGAALSAERAEGAARGAEAAAVDAAADAQLAELAAAEAEASREAAEADAKLAGARAAEAEASAKVAADAVSDALAARDEAAAARGGAEDAMRAAGARAGEAEDSADAAEVSRAGAEVAQVKAEAAQAEAEAALGRAEDQASIATAAAEAAQAPESIAAQAARPATMVLLKDELERMLGSSDAFIVDTDGQKIVVHTDRLEGEQLAAVEDMLGRFVPQFIDVMRYNHHIEISPQDLNKYAECESVSDFVTVDSEKNSIGNPWPNEFVTNDLTTDGEWWYNLDNIQRLGNDGVGYPFSHRNDLIIFNSNLQNLTSGVGGFYKSPNLKEIRADMQNVTQVANMCNGCKSLSVFTSPLPKIGSWRSTGSVFNDCILNKESILIILNSLGMSYDQSMTIGVHVDHQTDDEVLAAIANAESKNWNLVVQWNGTPTAQASVTYGLRKPSIYARVSEHELPDGTVEHYLDWGHYVTDPTGYEEFRSVEAAREYFGLPEEI